MRFGALKVNKPARRLAYLWTSKLSTRVYDTAPDYSLRTRVDIATEFLPKLAFAITEAVILALASFPGTHNTSAFRE